MDTILVTGATGLVGYHIVQALLQRGRRVKAFVRSIDKGKALLPSVCELVQGDITDQAAGRRAMEGCSVVYHAAGLEEKAAIGSRYILSESYCTLAELAQAVLVESGLEKQPPPTIPLPVARGMAWIGELLSRITRRPPLLAQGGLVFLQWQAHPSSEKAQRELGWKPTPLREGLKETITFLKQESSGGDAAD